MRIFLRSFWTGIKSQYDTLIAAEQQLDEGVATKVGNKKVMATQLRVALNSIILLIKSNYPDTWKSVLREFGFQKEDY